MLRWRPREDLLRLLVEVIKVLLPGHQEVDRGRLRLLQVGNRLLALKAFREAGRIVDKLLDRIP
eukprot:1200052-Prymnesium_polylepis.1